MIISKDSTPEQKEALRQALRQQSLQMAVRGAAPEDIQSLPEDFEPPSYSENTRPLYDGQLFPKITSADDLIANGYATPDGQPTEQGKMAISLKKVGALNDDYTLNNTGRMMLASQDDLLKEENIDLYREYKRLEFDEAPDVGIWDMAKGIAADLVKGANAIAENELGGIKDIASSQAFGGAFEQYGAEPLTPEKRAESRIRTEEAAKDLFVSSAGLMRAAATEIDKVAAKTMWDGMMQDYQVAYLEQKYDRDLADMEKVNTAEVADELAKVIGLSTQFAEGRQQAEELLGPEASQKAIEEGRAAGLALSVVNPLAPEALVARTGFAAARKGVSAAFKPISRKLLESEARAAQALQARQRVTGLQGNLAQVNYLAQKAEQEAVFAERQADKYSRLGLTNRANDARAFADKLRTRGLEAGAKVQGLTDEIARASEEASKLAQDAAVADKINFIAQKAREIPGLPIQAIGGLVEGTGMAMIGIDKGLSKLASKIGADKVYNTMNKITTLSGLGTVVSAAGVGPAAFIPAAIKTAWSTAPFLKGAGHFVRMIGKETANARELIPFWQRVANYETLGATQRAIAHLMDTSTLGSRVTGLAGDVAKGMAAAYPVDLAFEWISEGGEMDMNTLKQAAAETVVFGGGGALGGITAGSKERIKKLQRGSALNFYRNIKDGGQRVAFNALNDGMKRSIGTYSAAFPNLNIRFTDQGGGAFDPASNTAFINPMSRNPLKPLLAHEINHYILIRNQMEGGISAALVGDGVQTGGLLRGKDGRLDENFLAFKEEYTRRLEAQHNRQINQKIAAGEKVPAKQRQFIKPTDNDIAIEYFVDSMADDMMEMAETGELGKQAGRMLVNRKMQAFGNAILQKAPIIKDFFYKLGGVTDQNGRAVYGNGLLAEGIREIPQMKKLFRQMISESAGRPMHVAKVTKGESEGHTIPITGKNDPILDEMTSMYESDENGVPLRDKNGDRIPLSDETERLRASSGLLLLEDQENRLNRGETLEEGELRFNPEENAWTGEYLTDRQIQILRASGRFNNAQMRQLEMLNGAAQENTGRRFLVFNQPATKKRKGKRLDYETLGISMREIVPYGIKITKDGNILVRLMSVQQLHANAFEKAASKRGQSLYRGDVEAILRDVNQVIENHGRNEPTDAYFKREYGTEWEVRKNFINTVFGNVGKGQKDINPLLAAEKAKNAVVKTYRIDRINKATELEGRTKLPYQNHLVKVNFMPEGEPILDANGEPKDLRYTPRIEDRLEQRQMPEGEAPAPSQTRFMPEGVDEDKFYSQLDRVITDKVPSRATPQQIINSLGEYIVTKTETIDGKDKTTVVGKFPYTEQAKAKSLASSVERGRADWSSPSQVKEEEIKWSGIDQALASLEKDGKVSKEDLLNYLRNEGRVRFEEVDVGKAYTPQDLEKMRKEAEQSGDFSRYDEALLQNLHDGTKYSQYQLPGGDNYREVVLAMEDTAAVNRDRQMNEIAEQLKNPNLTEDQKNTLRVQYKNLSDYSTGYQGYRSNHFPDIPNYVAHMRTNERVDVDGRPGLFVEEFQSDRHQEGRKKGYASDRPSKEEVISTRNEIWRAYDAGEIALDERNQRLESLGAAGGVADAPFRTTWPLQLFKRALRDAVDSGKEWVGWTTGETQAERFDLSKSVDQIAVHKRTDAYSGEKTRSVFIQMPVGEGSITLGVNKDGIVDNTDRDHTQFMDKRLDDVIGKEMAQKIMDADSGTIFKGDDLKVGGSGMKGFYDTMLPKEIGKYVSKFKGKVEKSQIGQSISREDLDIGDLSDATPEELAQLEAQGRVEGKAVPIWKVSITPEMRQLAQGQMRFMPEKDIPVAKTTSESLEESDNKELKSTGIDVPESVDDQSVISNAIKVANSQPWRKGRDFKLDLQRRVLEAAKQAGVNISERTLESIEYLARVGFKDALIALEQNPNAIGWYDEKTKQALGVMSLLFPEIATDENARFAFTWALAVTSNGLKVDKNFELAERVYRQYRKTGKMPTDIKAGQAQEAINDGLGLFNKLTKEWGIDNTRKFMQTDFTVGEISRLSKDLSPGGEFSDTSVRGSAILGPKIGNGFFSNLYGLFDALTMDRWLVRTWGRWTGTLVELNPELTKQATDRLREAVKNLTPADKERMDGIIKNDISKMDVNDLSVAIQKASMKQSLRDLMNKTPTGEEFRKSGNGLAKYLDGQKEAPANPAERNFIREIFGLMLDELRADPRYKDLTMADLQAVLWYAEKRLYETAKVNTDQKDLDSSDADGYEDDEAPDYANAAIGVAKKQGISDKRINQVLEKVRNERATTTQLTTEERGQDQSGQQKGAGGFVGREKQKFKQYVAVTTTRRNRTGNEKALWSYQTKSGVDSGDARLLKPKTKKNLGVKYISEWKPGRKLATIFRNNSLPTVKFLELDSTDAVSAQKFADTIQQSKDESPHGAAVYVYPVDEYQGMKLFLSDSGKSGFAVKPDGDIVSVFSMEKGSGRSIMEAAISAGGKKLDAFDTILPEFYGTHGFVEAARMPWNDEFAPEGWDKQTFKEFNNGEPDVVMMVLDPSFEGEYTPRTDIYTTDYDQAVEMQDAMLKKVGRKKPTVKPSQPAPQKTTKKSTAKGNSSAIANAANLK